MGDPRPVRGCAAFPEHAEAAFAAAGPGRVVLLAAGALVGYGVSRQSTPTSGAPAVSVDTTTTTETAVPITLKVYSTDPTTQDAEITVDVDGQEAQYTNAVLPWSYQLPLGSHPQLLSVIAINSYGSGDLTCEIDVPGQSPVVVTSSGFYAWAVCS